MGIMNEAKRGADLTHPKISVGYVISASIAVIVLLIVFAIGGYLYSKAKDVTTGVTSGATGAVGSVVGVFGNGT